jgi:uncharacterized protein YxjI
MTAPMALSPVGLFTQPSYLIRRKVFKLLGGAFHVYDPAGQLVGFSKMKAFKLKEDIRLYSDESLQRELFRIQARNIIDFSAAYDVFDAQTNQKLGAFKRKGFSSMFRDSWIIMDDQDREIGSIKEDSTALALLRRFVEIVTWFLPQSYQAECVGQSVCQFKQNMNPFVQKIAVSFHPAIDQLLDRRMMIAAGLLLLAIEGRQQG